MAVPGSLPAAQDRDNGQHTLHLNGVVSSLHLVVRNYMCLSPTRECGQYIGMHVMCVAAEKLEGGNDGG